MLANCSLLLGPYFAQNFASKFGQGLVVNTQTQVPDRISYKTSWHFSAGGCSFVRLWNLPTVGQNHGTGSGDLHVITEQNQFVGKSMSSTGL